MKFYSQLERLNEKKVLQILQYLLQEKPWIRQENATNCGEQQCIEKSPVLPMNGGRQRSVELIFTK